MSIEDKAEPSQPSSMREGSPNNASPQERKRKRSQKGAPSDARNNSDDDSTDQEIRNVKVGIQCLNTFLSILMGF